MSDHHSPEAIARIKKKYLLVFGALLFGTFLTVALYFFYFEKMWLTVTVAMVVATIKATLVAAIFMHLSDEKKTIYNILCCAAAFLVGLMWLTIWAMNDAPDLTVHIR